MNQQASVMTFGLGDEAPSRGRAVAVAVIVLATLLGASVRYFELHSGGVWIDELYTVRDVSTDHTGYSPTRWFGYQPTRIALAVQGINSVDIPGRQYWLYQDGGVTVGDARLASYLIGVLSIPLLAWAGWRPLGPGFSAVIAVLLALCIWHVSWSQTARFYTQVSLFGGLAVLWYLDAIKTGSRWRFTACIIAVVLAYLSHPPAIMIGGVMVLDTLISLARRRALNYGKWGWGLAIGGVSICVGVMLFEQLQSLRGYNTFLDVEAKVGKAVPAQSAPSVVLYSASMLTPALVMASFIGLALGRQLRAVWVLGFAALIPMGAVIAIALAGGAVHGRYSFVSLIGWIGLAAVGVVLMERAMRERLGKVLAWSPGALLIVAMLPQLGSYLTGGERFIEPFHLAYEALGDRIEPGDAVFAERFEIAQYYLGREDVQDLPGAVDVIDERAAGRIAWIVRLSANSRGHRPWALADHPRMDLVFQDASATWLPYREVSVYRLSPPTDGGGTEPNIEPAEGGGH